MPAGLVVLLILGLLIFSGFIYWCNTKRFIAQLEHRARRPPPKRKPRPPDKPTKATPHRRG